jgi:hypothetical protein
MKVVLKDGCPVSKGETTVNIRKGKGGSTLEIVPEGYGQKGYSEGEGAPIYLERYEGKLVLRVFGDINSDAQTIRVDLDGAKEAARATSAATASGPGGDTDGFVD